jgi:hypothetical protein
VCARLPAADGDKITLLARPILYFAVKYLHITIWWIGPGAKGVFLYAYTKCAGEVTDEKGWR